MVKILNPVLIQVKPLSRDRLPQPNIYYQQNSLENQDPSFYTFIIFYLVLIISFFYLTQ